MALKYLAQMVLISSQVALCFLCALLRELKTFCRSVKLCVYHVFDYFMGLEVGVRASMMFMMDLSDRLNQDSREICGGVSISRATSSL